MLMLCAVNVLADRWRFAIMVSDETLKEQDVSPKLIKGQDKKT